MERICCCEFCCSRTPAGVDSRSPLLHEEVAAAVVLCEGAEVAEREIRTYASERIADFKVPRTVLIVDEIPKGPTGKLQRIGLAEKLGLG